MKNYIEYYFDENGKFAANIHKDGKYKVVKNEANLYKLLEISQKHGYKIDREGVLKHSAKQITKEYEKYIKRKKRLHIIGNVLSNMKITRKNPTLGKVVVTASLLAVIATHGLGGKKNETVSTDDINTNTPSSVVQMVETPISETVEEITEAPIHVKLEQVNNESKSEDIKIETKKATEKQEQINSMFEKDSFHYSFEDRSSKTNISNAKRYEDIFEKYANRYGLDKNLLMAIAAQESSGDHYNNLNDRKPAAGIMQVEKAIHIGNTVKAYNFETNQMESITVTKEKLKDIESNIQIGSMILREYIENNNYNIPLAIQTYNMGPGNMSKVLNTCSSLENIEVATMKNNPTNNKWLNYRAFLNVGDSKYVEHVFSYLGKNANIQILKRDKEKVSVSLTNDYMQVAKK